ncbi:hypothetical protein Tco_0061323, partial [Tanacetum coccineum]
MPRSLFISEICRFREGSFSSQIRAAPSRENGKSISLTDVLGTFWELHRRSDLVEISDVG